MSRLRVSNSALSCTVAIIDAGGPVQILDFAALADENIVAVSSWLASCWPPPMRDEQGQLDTQRWAVAVG